MIEWKKSYEVGVVAFDNEHKRLVELINFFYEATRARESLSTLLPMFDALVDYTREHFSHEERLMEEYEYPQLTEHQHEHLELTKQVYAYRDQLATPDDISAGEVMKFLRGWLLDHIVKQDKQAARFLEVRAGRFVE